jgi:hypothetical protein
MNFGTKIDLNNSLVVYEKHPCPWDGIERKIYKISIDLLHYNETNGRIATFVSGFNNETNHKKLDELPQEEFNSIISDFIKSSSSSLTYNNTKNDIRDKGQLVIGAVLDDGTVISGNRRFTVLRELFKETGNKDKYGYFLCCVYPCPVNEEEKKTIKRLEIQTQYSEDKAVQYSPIERLVDIYNNVLKSDSVYSENEYKNYFNLKDSQFENLKERAIILIEYLDYIKCPNNYDIARKDKLDGPINELANFKKKIGEEEWNKIKTIFYQYLSTANGDKTRLIRSFIREYQRKPQEVTKINEEFEKSVLDNDTIEGFENKSNVSDNSSLFKEKIEDLVQKGANELARRKPINEVKDVTNYFRKNVELDLTGYLSDDEKAEFNNSIDELIVLANSCKIK